jgi:hypothetical protein
LVWFGLVWFGLVCIVQMAMGDRRETRGCIPTYLNIPIVHDAEEAGGSFRSDFPLAVTLIR